ncbi:hypothetical protein [Sphingomonas lenta]|uniref:Uncharacterized protein n=1 Tax=Sphingomonas lenta TaxID=1141887 RepID=A0A2A2SFC7_9SPHN|nr:hypothetical protein [Sphingomonas lenta]PAX07711.1 hypothetical protein CKY28_08710 [Sphingomonas lenta]
MRRTLVCGRCGGPLTRPLIIWSTKDPATPAPVHRDGAALTEPGAAYKSWQAQQWSSDGTRVPLDFTPQYWINPLDLTEAVRAVTDARRLNGCCGLDGCDGPNQRCECGAEIGTLRSDCWTDHVFIPEPDATDLVDVGESKVT